MQLKTLIRCSASAAVLAFASTPAVAQDAPPADPTAAQPAGPGDPAAGEGEEVVVTGLRESLTSQQNIRRNSSQIVDAIVAEDIGKLPDIAVSDTAARIPGVQVERSGGEAGRVLVRGLPDFATTYNGREIFTAETSIGRPPGFPVRPDRRDRSVQDLLGGSGRARARRPGERPLASTVRLRPGAERRRIRMGPVHLPG